MLMLFKIIRKLRAADEHLKYLYLKNINGLAIRPAHHFFMDYLQAFTGLD
jgi:hypothetical protein